MKKLICILLSLLVLFSLAACSKDGEKPSAAPGQSDAKQTDSAMEYSGIPDETDDDGEHEWSVSDKSVGGWDLRILNDPAWDYVYDVPVPEYADTSVEIAGEQVSLSMLQSPFNYTYDELVDKMKEIGFIDDTTKLYTYDQEELRYYPDWNKCDAEYIQGFRVRETGRQVLLQTGGVGINGTSKITLVLSDGENDDLIIDQGFAFETLKALVGEKLALYAVYFTEPYNVEKETPDEQLSAHLNIQIDECYYNIERRIYTSDGKIDEANISVEIEPTTWNKPEDLWNEYSKEETGAVKYIDSPHVFFPALGVTFTQPMNEENCKELFAFGHDGFKGSVLESLEYSRGQQWDRSGEDETMDSFHYTVKHNSDPDLYTKPYLSFDNTVFEAGDKVKSVFYSGSGYFDVFRAKSNPDAGDAWDAEREAANKELCETASKMLSILLQKDVTVDYGKLELANGLMRTEFTVESNVSGSMYEYSVKIELGYGEDYSTPGQYYFYGNLFFA